MEHLVVASADTNMHGANKKNIFIARNQNGEKFGLALIYPFFDYDLEPEHPHNLYLHLHVEQERDEKNAIKDMLLKKAIQRATEIKAEEKQSKTRLYACFLKHQQEEINYFLERGFIHDEGMQILERYEQTDLLPLSKTRGLTVQSWKMETETEQERFIETHREVFPRHPYNTESLQKIRSQYG